MFISLWISRTNEPKKDTAFDSQPELNRFFKEEKFTFNSANFKKIQQHLSENGTWEQRKTAVSGRIYGGSDLES